MEKSKGRRVREMEGEGKEGGGGREGEEGEGEERKGGGGEGMKGGASCIWRQYNNTHLIACIRLS